MWIIAIVLAVLTYLAVRYQYRVALHTSARSRSTPRSCCFDPTFTKSTLRNCVTLFVAKRTTALPREQPGVPFSNSRRRSLRSEALAFALSSRTCELKLRRRAVPNKRLKLAAPSYCGGHSFVKSCRSRRSLGAIR